MWRDTRNCCKAEADVLLISAVHVQYATRARIPTELSLKPQSQHIRLSHGQKYSWVAGVIKQVRMEPDAFDTYPMQISKDASTSVHEAFAQGCQDMAGIILGQRPALVSRESPAFVELLCNNFRHDHSQ
jgi:hypothetical protein